MRKCARCNIDKPLDEFHRNPQTPDGRAAYCKPCACDNTREWNAANRERKRASDARWKASNLERVRRNRRSLYLKKKYGLTLDEAEAALARGCDVCGTHDDLRIDHDHESGVVRGVLCHSHNQMEGWLARMEAEGCLDALVAYVKHPPGVARL